MVAGRIVLDLTGRLLHDCYRGNHPGEADTPFEPSIHTFTLDGNVRRRVFRPLDRKQEVRSARGVKIRQIKYREVESR